MRSIGRLIALVGVLAVIPLEANAAIISQYRQVTARAGASLDNGGGPGDIQSITIESSQPGYFDELAQPTLFVGTPWERNGTAWAQQTSTISEGGPITAHGTCASWGSPPPLDVKTGSSGTQFSVTFVLDQPGQCVFDGTVGWVNVHNGQYPNGEAAVALLRGPDVLARDYWDPLSYFEGGFPNPPQISFARSLLLEPGTYRLTAEATCSQSALFGRSDAFFDLNVTSLPEPSGLVSLSTALALLLCRGGWSARSR